MRRFRVEVEIPALVIAGRLCDKLRHAAVVDGICLRPIEERADIGVARAELFPRISLTGLAGLASDALGSLLSGGALTTTLAGDAAYTIFDAGGRRANVAVSEAERDAALAAYELANRFNEYPWMVDLTVWRARRSPALLARLAGVLDESQDPSDFVSARGLVRLLFQPR